jgi:hypothetical protein
MLCQVGVPVSAEHVKLALPNKAVHKVIKRKFKTAGVCKDAYESVKEVSEGI